MNKNIFTHKFNFKHFRISALILVICLAITAIMPIEMQGKTRAKRHSHTSVVSKKGKRSNSKTRGNKKRAKRQINPVSVLYSDENGAWIHKGKRGIIISCDTSGVVRAMNPLATNSEAGKGYAQAINEYSRQLQEDGVRVYSLIAPTQGEYYMPEMVSTRGAEQRAIKTTARYFDEGVTPVYVDSIFKCHLEEEIYNRTDHHWSPLGAHYASEALTKAANVNFLPINCYTPDTIRNYVGTMYKFSGDPEVKNHPEDFVWYVPREGYKAEFIDYQISGGHTVGESEKREGPFFIKFNDGSGAAYCTFMGGDYRTAKVSNTGGTPGRRLLIVKDSFGNAMASNLFGSFEEVHVIDFRYFPHSLIDYVRDNNITDLCFVNCTSIAFAPTTTNRLQIMLEEPKAESAQDVDKLE